MDSRRDWTMWAIAALTLLFTILQYADPNRKAFLAIRSIMNLPPPSSIPSIDWFGLLASLGYLALILLGFQRLRRLGRDAGEFQHTAGLEWIRDRGEISAALSQIEDLKERVDKATSSTISPALGPHEMRHAGIVDPRVRTESSVPRVSPPPTVISEPMAWPDKPGISSSTRDLDVYYASSIRIHGVNKSQKEVRLEEAYLVSGVSGAEVTMRVEVPKRVPGGWGSELVAIGLINPIPPGAAIDLVVDLRAGTEMGLVEREFMNLWGRMSFVVKYDGAEYRKFYDEQTIAGLFQKLRYGPPPPRVTKTGDENPYAL